MLRIREFKEKQDLKIISEPEIEQVVGKFCQFVLCIHP